MWWAGEFGVGGVDLEGDRFCRLRAGQLEFEARARWGVGGCDHELDRGDLRDEKGLSCDKMVRVGELVDGDDGRGRDAELFGDRCQRVAGFHLVGDRRDSCAGGGSGRSGGRATQLLRVAEQGFEGLPVGSSATVSTGDGEVDALALDRPGDMRALGSPIDLTAEPSTATLRRDLVDHATADERARVDRGATQEPRRGRAPIAGQCCRRRLQHAGSSTGLLHDRELCRRGRRRSRAATSRGCRHNHDNEQCTPHTSP